DYYCSSYVGGNTFIF
nr:immunoglobulin light chain junction region [Macaca mulatta]MOX28502.1 immunoglobulin light chain junction region [Macaca mulatta]MOX28643.1 immunoglobulin light chain junction region [Macaca mulatta]MOX28879.1 immunoglobulin light chain junction region [Macaca mulatta]MOX29006.1 immunoglobulin light chain junction region [Macaca mulatta]